MRATCRSKIKCLVPQGNCHLAISQTQLIPTRQNCHLAVQYSALLLDDEPVRVTAPEKPATFSSHVGALLSTRDDTNRFHRKEQKRNTAQLQTTEEVPFHPTPMMTTQIVTNQPNTTTSSVDDNRFQRKEQKRNAVSQQIRRANQIGAVATNATIHNDGYYDSHRPPPPQLFFLL